MTMAQHDQFSARLKRINSGKTAHWTVPGEGLASHRQEARIAQNAPGKTWKRAKAPGGILMLPIAILTGAVAVVAGRWLTFSYLGADGPLGVDLAEMAGPFVADIALAAALSVLFMLIFALTSKLRALLHLAAFGAVLFYEHELVRQVPDLYAMLYPPSWVAEMLAIPSVLPI